MEKNIIKKYLSYYSINKHVDEVLQWLEKLIKIFAILFLLSFNVSATKPDQWLDSENL